MQASHHRGVEETASIRAVRYAFPGRSATVRELGERGLLESDPELLTRFGFERVHVAEGETPYELALAAARGLLRETDTDPESVGLLIWGGSQGAAAFLNDPSIEESVAVQRTTARFRFPGTRLQHELGLDGASVLGIDQMGCNSLFAAVRVARSLCLVEGIERALCVSSDFYPADAGREAIYNCTSDAAVAALVERSGERNRIISATQVTKGYYWDPDALQDQVVASYFPTAKHVLEETIARARWEPADVDWIIPHNVSRRSWDILSRLVDLPRARVWCKNIPRLGHTLAGDNFINLRDALDEGAVRPGQKLVLFSYAYGAHWNGLAVEA